MSIFKLPRTINDRNFVPALSDLLSAIDRRLLSLEYRAISGGETADRPIEPYPFQIFADSTLGELIYYDGTNWVDFGGNTV